MRITTHPGEILREEFMLPMQLSANKLSGYLGVPLSRITEILNEKRGVSADTALRLSRFFGTSSEFWLNLQMQHDLSKVRAEKEIELCNIPCYHQIYASV